MTFASAATLLRPWPARFGLVAAFGAAVLAASSPAAAQDPCAGPGAGRLRVANYHFSFLSQVEGRGSGARSVHCVRNNHPRRGVFVDWRGAGLRSLIPPGEDIVHTTPLAGRAASRRPFSLFYGARPNVIPVPTMAGGEPLPLGPDLARSAGSLLRLAAWTQPAAGAAASESEGTVYIPVDGAFLQGFADRPLSSAEMIEWLETHPNLLQPLSMTFKSQMSVDASGQVNIAYECIYGVPEMDSTRGPPLYLDFADPALNRLMFEDGEPFPVQGGGGYMTTLGGNAPPLAPGQAETRTTELRILLGDRRTVVASIQVTYSAPRGS